MSNRIASISKELQEEVTKGGSSCDKRPLKCLPTLNLRKEIGKSVEIEFF